MTVLSLIINQHHNVLHFRQICMLDLSFPYPYGIDITAICGKLPDCRVEGDGLHIDADLCVYMYGVRLMGKVGGHAMQVDAIVMTMHQLGVDPTCILAKGAKLCE